MKNYHKGFVKPLLIIIIILLIAGGGYYLFSKKQLDIYQVSLSNQKITDSKKFDDSDLKISLIRIPDSENSSSAFNAIKSDAISPPDQNFIKQYFINYSSKKLPPITQSQKILDSYSNLLTIFNNNSNKKYQCSFVFGDTCSLTSIRNMAYLSGIKATTLFQQNKSIEAQGVASDIVIFGKNITANSDEVITLLVGWSIQNIGYNILTTVKSINRVSNDEKTNLISNLRLEQKNVLRYLYTYTAEQIDYITSSDKKPTRPLYSDEEDLINIYRNNISINPKSWNPDETKEYFYKSYKISLSNIDLDCDKTPTTIKINTDFNPQDESAENYIGKTFYSTVYASMDSLSKKRCDIEKIIQNL